MKDLSDIYNWRRVDVRLTTSGQPSEAQLEDIQKLGVTHIINLGMHDHKYALEDERASVTGLGMHYIHIGVPFDNPSTEDFKAFCDIMAETRGAKVHVHCIANLRVTAFLYKYWTEEEQMNKARARSLMDTVWQPGGVWAEFVGDDDSIEHPHRPPVGETSWPSLNFRSSPRKQDPNRVESLGFIAWRKPPLVWIPNQVEDERNGGRSPISTVGQWLAVQVSPAG